MHKHTNVTIIGHFTPCHLKAIPRELSLFLANKSELKRNRLKQNENLTNK